MEMRKKQQVRPDGAERKGGESAAEATTEGELERGMDEKQEEVREKYKREGMRKEGGGVIGR